MECVLVKYCEPSMFVGYISIMLGILPSYLIISTIVFYSCYCMPPFSRGLFDHFFQRMVGILRLVQGWLPAEQETLPRLCMRRSFAWPTAQVGGNSAGWPNFIYKLSWNYGWNKGNSTKSTISFLYYKMMGLGVGGIILDSALNRVDGGKSGLGIIVTPKEMLTTSETWKLWAWYNPYHPHSIYIYIFFGG